MTDYSELVKALRCENTGDDECGSSDCTYWSGLGCMDGKLMEDAADAIEELQQIADHYEQSAKDWWQEAMEYKIKSADGITAEESKEIIKRFKSIPCGPIEPLPKRGEIVRCRECRWGTMCVTGQHLGLDGFCSKGEREVQE